MTPGKNVKRYLAGAMDARTDRAVWVKDERKTSRLFIALPEKLLSEYADKEVYLVASENRLLHFTSK
jgi:hypothetical protein